MSFFLDFSCDNSELYDVYLHDKHRYMIIVDSYELSAQLTI
jgi:hypothetical protein